MSKSISLLNLLLAGGPPEVDGIDPLPASEPGFRFRPTKTKTTKATRRKKRKAQKASRRRNRYR